MMCLLILTLIVGTFQCLPTCYLEKPLDISYILILKKLDFRFLSTLTLNMIILLAPL